MNTLASQFIDDEMNLPEKKVFVETVHKDPAFYRETIDLLDQEMLLAGDAVGRTPAVVFPEQPVEAAGKKRFRLLYPMGLGLAAAAAVLVLWLSPGQKDQPPTQMNRFVIYKPEATKVEITGTFTKWERVPLREAGNSGYWEVTLELPRGVHRFTYILDDHTPFADPTVLACEQDDFGGVDSIISTEI